MIPIFQTDRSVASGNCLQAALASVLEVPLEAVPHFSRDESDETFYDAVRGWLMSAHGFTVMCFPESFWAENQPVYHLISGRVAGINHVIVGKDGEGCHDPFGCDPKAVKASMDDRMYWFFIAVDPSLTRKGGE